MATPNRWGAATALYHKLTEPLNCVQNQISIHDRVLIRTAIAVETMPRAA